MPDVISRREFIKDSLGAISALSAPTIINYLGQSYPSSDKEFLEIRDDKFYMGGDEYIIKGANYLTRDHPWQMFEEYDPKEVEKELSLARNLGVNSLRVLINYQFSTNNVDWEKPFSHTEIDDDYLKNFEEFLSIADDKDMKVVPTLFDRLYWTVYREDKRKYAADYLDDLIPPFSNDERILAWDLNNEPNRDFEGIGKETTLSFLKYISDKVRSIGDNHPLTIGWSGPRLELIEETDNAVDFCSFHHGGYPEKMRETYHRIREKTDKPILLEEFGLPTLEDSEVWPHSEEDQQEYYEKTLQNLADLETSGAMFWCLLDFPERLLEEGDNPFLPEEDYQYHMGVLRTDYSKKPAAHVVEQYYKWIL